MFNLHTVLRFPDGTLSLVAFVQIGLDDIYTIGFLPCVFVIKRKLLSIALGSIRLVHMH